MNKAKISFRLVFAVILLLVTPVMLTSCLKGDSAYEKQIKIDDAILSKHLTDNNIQALRHYSGFYYVIEDGYYGGGTSLVRNNVVSFYYNISLLNGTHIQSISKATGDKPVQFSLLSNTIVPQGLDYGISLMKVGEKYRFYIPSYLAYGTYGCDLFPPNSIFVITVEVVGAKSEDDVNDIQLDSIQQYANVKYPSHVKYESGLFFIDSVPGTGSKPSYYSNVTIDFTRKYLNDRTIKSVLGTSFDLDRNNAVPGLEEGLKLMKEGGSAIMLMPSSIAFKQSLCIVPQAARQELLNDGLITSEVEPYSILKYVVKLKNTTIY